MNTGLPTCMHTYTISIRDIRREDALTLSELALHLGADMLGACAMRCAERDGFTVCWSSDIAPDLKAPPDMIVTGASTLPDIAHPRGGASCSITRAPAESHLTVLALGEHAALKPAGYSGTREGEAPLLGSGYAPLARAHSPLYTLGAAPNETLYGIAALCRCPAAYVALGALCRATGFVPMQLIMRMLETTVGSAAPHMLSNCAEGALRGYRQTGA